MKKFLILTALLATAAVASADWQEPVYSGSYAPLTPEDTVYIFNTGAKKFLTEGNDYGTHASVGSTGLKFIVSKYVEDGAEWDGKTYTIKDYSITKSGWKNLFIEASGLYVDRGSQADYFFSFKDLGDNTYNIYGADLNPIYCATGEMAGYTVGNYTGYYDTQDAIETGTGVIYDDPAGYKEGEFNTVWAFVSQSEYAKYCSTITTYQTAQKLAAEIETAKGIGVDVTSAQAVYDNTSSTTEELNNAIAALDQSILKYYEETVTPSNPLDMTSRVANSTCDVKDEGWINEINCSSLGTGNWVPDGSDEGATDGTYLSGWDPSLHGKAYQVISGIPNGIYQVSMGVLSQKLPMVMYANDNRKDVPKENLFHNYSVITNVTDGTIEFGLIEEETGENWFCFDNVSLNYFGSGVEAYRQWLSLLLEGAPKFDDVVVQDSLLNAYNAVLASVETVSTKEEIMNIIPAYEAISNEINNNVKAYSNLKAALDDENEWYELSNTYYGEPIADYVMTVATPAYENHTLSTVAINGIVAQMEEYKDTVQEFNWKLQDYIKAVENLKESYNQYSETCAPETATAAKKLIDELDAFDTANCQTSDIVAILPTINDMLFQLQIPADPASDDNPVDYTSMINYPSFYDGSKGWTNDGWQTCGTNNPQSNAGECLDDRYLNLWNSTGGCRVYQVVSNLPNGTYSFSIGAYSSATGLQVYANDNYTDVDAGAGSDGYMAHIYEVIATVTDGTLEIGVRYTGKSDVWAMIDNCKLIYYGTDSKRTTAITDVSNEVNSAAEAIYTIAGARVSSPVHGINIIRTKDGKVRKVYNR